MPDLDLVLQIGPSVEITLAGGRFKPNYTRLEFPCRAALATDFRAAQSFTVDRIQKMFDSGQYSLEIANLEYGRQAINNDGVNYENIITIGHSESVADFRT